MQLTMHTDYALRLLIYLAVHNHAPAPVQEAAAAYGISGNHLAKVAQKLTQLGYVRSIRGRRGGLLLGLPPEEINLGKLVRETEPTLALVACFEPDSGCPIEPACGLKRVLQDAQVAFFESLEQYTLADLVARPGKLVTLLVNSRPA